MKLQNNKRTRWLIFGVLAIGYILVYFHRLCTAVVAVDIMNDLHTGATIIGVLASAYFYPYAIMQLPAGLLADSIGPRRTITIFFLLAGIGSAIMGFSEIPATAIAGRLLVGIGVAMLFVPTLKVLASWFGPGEFASMTGILVAMGGVGSLIAAAPLAFASARIGWRMSFILVAGLTFLSALFIWIIVRDSPDNGASSPAGDKTAREGAIGLKEGIKIVLSSRHFWPLASWFFFTSAIFFCYGGLWGGPYLMQVYGMTRADAGNVLSMIAFGMIAGSPIHSLLSDRFFKRRKPVIILSGIVTLAVTGAFALFTDTLPVPVLYILTFCMGFFTNAIVVIGFTVAKELFPVGIAGTSTGIANFFPFMGGALFQPLLGYILEWCGKSGGAYTVTGYRYTYILLFACGAAAFISACGIRETMKRKS